MPLSILINIFLAMKYGWFRVEVYRYSSPMGLPSLLVSSKHGSLTFHLRNLIQARSGNEELHHEFGGKRRREIWMFLKLGFCKKPPKSSPYLYIERKHHCNGSLGFSIQIQLSYVSQQTLSAKWRLPFFCAYRSDAWFYSWPYRTWTILIAQDWRDTPITFL